MYVASLAFKSLWNRRLATILTVLSISFSVSLFLGIERIRSGAHDGFANTISKTDLIVGAKGGTIQLLLYTVFRIGSATDNMSYESYQKLSEHPEVAWTIPYSLGDSHRGFRVVGTDNNFYKHYQYLRGRHITFLHGREPNNIFEVVLGESVAKELGYHVGDSIVLSHGVSDVAFQDHSDKPFTVVGVLKRTATPIDRSLYITLQGMEAIHMDWVDGAPPLEDGRIRPEEIKMDDIEIEQITAMLLGTKSRISVLQLQRDINDYENEPLMAIIPGVVLAELWDGISYAENGLRVVSFFVVVVGLLGMLVAIYNSLNERRREMAILRSLGVGASVVFRLMLYESMFLTCIGALLGIVLMYIVLLIGQPLMEEFFGIFVPIRGMTLVELMYLAAILGFSMLLAVIPAIRAYRNTLYDGLTIRT